jgi:hypothetical protein
MTRDERIRRLSTALERTNALVAILIPWVDWKHKPCMTRERIESIAAEALQEAGVKP